MDYLKKGLQGMAEALNQASKAIDLSLGEINKNMGELMTKANPKQQKRLKDQMVRINNLIKEATQGKDIDKVVNKTVSQIQKELENLKNASNDNG